MTSQFPTDSQTVRLRFFCCLPAAGPHPSRIRRSRLTLRSRRPDLHLLERNHRRTHERKCFVCSCVCAVCSTDSCIDELRQQNLLPRNRVRRRLPVGAAEGQVHVQDQPRLRRQHQRRHHHFEVRHHEELGLVVLNGKDFDRTERENGKLNE